MEHISREECVRVYKIDLEFFDELVDAGLIETFSDEKSVYLPYDKLTQFEKLVYWHYDLEINIPGLEVIMDLMIKLEGVHRTLEHI